MMDALDDPGRRSGRAPGISAGRRDPDRRARRSGRGSARAVRDRRTRSAAAGAPPRSKSRADEAQRARIWKGRKAAFAAMGRVSPNYYVQDGVVPRTRLPEVLRRIRDLEARSGLRIGNVFHAGDGNLHPLICYDEQRAGRGRSRRRRRRERSSRTASRPADRSPASTASARDKRDYMPVMFSEADLDVMRRVRARLRSARPVQSRKGAADAAPVRREGRALSSASRRAGRARRAFLSRQLQRHAVGSRVAARCSRRCVQRDGGLSVLATIAAVAGSSAVRSGTPRMPSTASSRRRRRTRHAGRRRPRAGARRPSAASASWCAAAGPSCHGDASPGRSTSCSAPRRLARVICARARRPDRGGRGGRHARRLESHSWRNGRSGCRSNRPFAGATIGGLLATNDAGPVQHRFGTPRDLLIGVHLATTDGRLVKAGGNVVKNVAGYDLGKLVTGSFGSLAVIVSATFKLTPMSAAVGTQRVTFTDRAAAAGAAHAVAASQLDPVALDVHARSGTHGDDGGAVDMLVRFASTSAVVDAEIAKAARLMGRLASEVAEPVLGAADAALWHAHRARPWEGTGAVIRVSWLPASLDAVLTLIDELGDRAARVELSGRAGIGTGLLRVDGDAATQLDVGAAPPRSSGCVPAGHGSPRRPGGEDRSGRVGRHRRHRRPASGHQARVRSGRHPERRPWPGVNPGAR